MADVKIVVTMDSAGAQRNAQEFEKAIEDLGKTTKKTDSAFGGLWKQFAIGQLAVGALRDGWRLFKDQIGDSVKAAIEAEQADKALDAALELTGRKAALTADQFIDYASALQKATVFGDEEIKSVQTLLIQMTNLDREGIDRATRGTLGLASALGMDLNAAAVLVQKAMAGQFQTLSRYGIVLDENLSAEGKRVQLLEKLDVLYGRATAETETFGGRLSQLKNRWNDVQEAAGKWITQQQGIIKLLNEASQTILDYLTMGEMLERSTRSQEEQENRLADRLGKAAAAAGWKYGEMAKLIEQYKGNFTALVRAITQEEHGTAIKLAYVAALREEKAEWTALEAARKRAERGTQDMGQAVKVTTKLVETELVAVKGLAHALYRLGMTELPPAKGLPEAQLAWLGLKTEVTDTASVWDSAMLSMTAGLVSFGDASATIWGNVGEIFTNFIQSAVGGIESLVLKEIWAARMTTKAKQAEATGSHIANIFKSVPFPLDLILAAGAFAVVNALFSKLLKFEKGGYFPSATVLPPHLVGEGGPEYYLPERTLERTLERVVVEKGGGGGAVHVELGAINIYAQTLDERVIDSIAPRLYRAIGDQMRLHGRRWN